MSLSSPLWRSNQEALSLSQQTTHYLQKHASTGTSIPFISYPESTEIWLMYEKLLLACLRTGDNRSAHSCLEKLIDRFGAANERVMGLRGLYQEAVAKDDAALEKILKEYNEILSDDPVNTPIAKRRIALFRSLSRVSDAIDALMELLESSPTDIEAWTELSDLYLSQTHFPQAIFCLEEVLLVTPSAWNVHARIGEVMLISATSGNASADGKTLAEAMRRFCRSIELCDDYLRGYYGLKLTTDRLLSAMLEHNRATGQMISADNSELPMPSKAVVRELNQKATSKLVGITRTSADKGYNYAEVVAAKILLDKDHPTRQR